MVDSELLRRYASDGDQAAFAELVRRHMGIVYAAAVRQVRDPHLAEDVTQIVFIALARHAGRLRADTVLASWLLTVTRSRSTDALKARARRLAHERMAAAAGSAAAEAPEAADAPWSEVAPLLDMAIARLGRGARDTLVLRYFDGRSIKEVAEALRIGEDAVKQRLSRAVRQLRVILSSRGVTVSAGALVGMLGAEAVRAYPLELVGRTVAGAMAAPAKTFWLKGVLHMIVLHKIKAGIITVVMLGAIVGTGVAKNEQKRADRDRVEAILTRARAALDNVKSMEARLEVTDVVAKQSRGATARVALLKPALGRVAYVDAAGAVVRAELSDGRQLFNLDYAQKTYHRPMLHGHTPDHRLTGVLPVLAAFFGPGPVIAGPEVHYGGVATIDGQRYEVLDYAYADNPNNTGKVYFEPGGIPVGWIQTGGGDHPVETRCWLKDVKLDPPLKPADFSFDPAAMGFKEFERSTEFDKTLIAVGRAAPVFELPRADGTRLALHDVLKTRKAVILNFWFANCGACRHELPQLEFLYQGFKDQGVEIIGIDDNGDTAQAVQKVADDGKLTFPLVLGSDVEGDQSKVGKDFGVQAYPTNYLLDANGKVVWRGSGFEEREIVDALAKLGIKNKSLE